MINNSNSKLELEKWGQGLPTLPVMMAQQVALGVEPAYELCLMARRREWLDGSLSIGHREEWFKQYDDTELLVPSTSVLVDFLGFGCDRKTKEEIRHFADELTGLSKLTARKVRRELEAVGDLGAFARECRRFEEAMYVEHIEEIRKTLAGNVEPNRISRGVLRRTSVRFFLRVAFPCWMEYGERPGDILKRAETGDFESLLKLAQLDPFTMENPKIRKQYIGILGGSNDTRRDLVTKALGGGSLRKLDVADVGILCAAVVHKLFDQYDAQLTVVREKLWKAEIDTVRIPKVKLSYRKVRDLFDAAARDMGGFGCDFLPDGRTFEMAVRRHRSFWPDLV